MKKIALALSLVFASTSVAYACPGHEDKKPADTTKTADKDKKKDAPKKQAPKKDSEKKEGEKTEQPAEKA